MGVGGHQLFGGESSPKLKCNLFRNFSTFCGMPGDVSIAK